jgi:hypothetical protein
VVFESIIENNQNVNETTFESECTIDGWGASSEIAVNFVFALGSRRDKLEGQKRIKNIQSGDWTTALGQTSFTLSSVPTLKNHIVMKFTDKL